MASKLPVILFLIVMVTIVYSYETYESDDDDDDDIILEDMEDILLEKRCARGQFCQYKSKLK